MNSEESRLSSEQGQGVSRSPGAATSTPAPLKATPLANDAAARAWIERAYSLRLAEWLGIK